MEINLFQEEIKIENSNLISLEAWRAYLCNIELLLQMFKQNLQECVPLLRRSL